MQSHPLFLLPVLGFFLPLSLYEKELYVRKQVDLHLWNFKSFMTKLKKTHTHGHIWKKVPPHRQNKKKYLIDSYFSSRKTRPLRSQRRQKSNINRKWQCFFLGKISTIHYPNKQFCGIWKTQAEQESCTDTVTRFSCRWHKSDVSNNHVISIFLQSEYDTIRGNPGVVIFFKSLIVGQRTFNHIQQLNNNNKCIYIKANAYISGSPTENHFW